ncbi:hypothetical protein D1872_338540 [compost metagenome]
MLGRYTTGLCPLISCPEGFINFILQKILRLSGVEVRNMDFGIFMERYGYC